MLALAKPYRKTDNLRPRKQKRGPGSVKTWPTWKLEQVLANDLTMGVNGADFGPIRDELQDELWSRTNKLASKLEKQDDKEWLAFDQWAAKRKVELRATIELIRESGELTYAQALVLKREVEKVTRQETCPFIWAIFEQGRMK